MLSSSESASSPTRVPVAAQQPTKTALIILRMVACLVDYFLFGSLLVILSLIAGILFGERLPQETPTTILQSNAPPWFMVIEVWMWPLYFIGVESLWRRSVGKLIMGLAIVSEDPQEKPLKTSVLRHFFDFVEILPFGVIALAVSLARKDGKRLGDLLAGSRVVSTR